MFNLAIPWWEFVARGLIVYAFLLILLRITGKRQVGQLAPFDLVLLLVLSNAVQNSMTGGDNSLIGGLISATTLVVINYGIGIATFRSKKVEAIIEGRPEVLIHNGKLFTDVPGQRPPHPPRIERRATPGRLHVSGGGALRHPRKQRRPQRSSLEARLTQPSAILTAAPESDF
ncbi:MAG: hypothetical protein ABI693_02330 [Bryobacteraceae bacterium]